MNERIADILRGIQQISSNPEAQLYRLVNRSILKAREEALYFAGDDDSGYLLLPPDSGNEMFEERFREILLLVSLIEKLEAENYLLVLRKNENREDRLFYDKALYLNKGQIDAVRDIGPGMELFLGGSKLLPYISQQGKKILETGLKMDADLSLRIRGILESEVYPTSQYIEYVSRGFRTTEQFALLQAAKSNKLAFTGIAVAIIVAIATPIVMHCFVETSIDSEQYKELVDSISATKVHDLNAVDNIKATICFQVGKKMN